MTARISLIPGKTGAHRAPLQLRLFNFFTASMTADDVSIRYRRRSRTSRTAATVAHIFWLRRGRAVL